MKRDILKIDEELCNGCGLCVPACHEGALKVIDGKVRLVSELMCDGLGACIGNCPRGAITIEQREAEPFDEIKVMEHVVLPEIHHHDNIASDTQMMNGPQGGGCPGSRTMAINRPVKADSRPAAGDQPSELSQWPIQMHLVNPNAPVFKGADLLLAADCVAFSMGNFHNSHLKGKALAIACPKLDHSGETYIEKITSMIEIAKVNTITVMMMEVPCCGGLLQMAMAALAKSSRRVPVKKIIINLSGEVISEEWL